MLEEGDWTSLKKQLKLNFYVYRVRQPGSRAENLWALETVLQRSVSPSDLISLLQLLISHAPVEPGRHFSRTESSQRSLHLGFWVLQSQHRLIMLRCSNNSISLLHVFISFSHSLPHFLSLLYIHAVFLLAWPLSTLFFPSLPLHTPPLPTRPPPSFSVSLQWPCTPSARSISPAWWCVWCWRWLRWYACCLRWRSPASLSITWEMTQSGRNHRLKTAATRTTRGILGIFMTRSRQDKIIVEIMSEIMSHGVALFKEMFLFLASTALQQVMLLQCLNFDSKMPKM